MSTFFWRGPARAIKDTDLVWPDIPGWSDDELIQAMPGGIVPAARLPNNWWHCFIREHPDNVGLQKKSIPSRTARTGLSEVKSFDSNEIDAVTKKAVVVRRSLKEFAARHRYGRKKVLRAVTKRVR